MDHGKNGGPCRTRTYDHRTKSPVYGYITTCKSTSYRDTRFHICTTMHNCTRLIHAKLTHSAGLELENLHSTAH